jgi:hypothetical protein
LGALEEFMRMNEIYSFIYYFAEKYSVNVSLLLYYNQILLLPMMKNYDVQNIYNMTTEEFISDMNRLKIYIYLVKYVTSVADYYKLDVNKKDVKDFLNNNIEKYLALNMDILGDDIDYYKFLRDPIEEDIIRYIININTNDAMIDYLYTMFQLPLDNKNAVKQLVKNKNLYKLFISYLQGNITKNELKNIIYFKSSDGKSDTEED